MENGDVYSIYEIISGFFKVFFGSLDEVNSFKTLQVQCVYCRNVFEIKLLNEKRKKKEKFCLLLELALLVRT